MKIENRFKQAMAIGLCVALGLTAGAATNRYNYGGQGFGYGHGAIKPPANMTFTNAGIRDLTLSAGQLSGVDPESGLALSVSNLLALKAKSLTVVGGAITGNGAGLTNLNAAKLVGIIPYARLPADLANGDQGITNEVDPQVGVIAASSVPKWNGSALVSGTIFDNGNIGIGTNAPTNKLEVVGAVKADFFIGSGSSLTGVIKAESDPTVPAAIKDGIAWSEVSGRPAGLDDGDQVGITTESDPVWLSQKSGYLTLNGSGAGLTNLRASSINGKIAVLNLPTSGIWNAQGMTLTNILVKGDGSGLTNLVEKDTIWNSVSGAVYSAIALKQNASTAATDGELAAASNALSSANAAAAMRLARVEAKTNVWNTAYAWGNHATNGYVTGTVVRAESDPQVGVIATSYLPKWNGSALVSGTIFDNGNVGIGTTTPSAKLDVSGGPVKMRGDVYCGGNLYVLQPGGGLSMGSFTNGLPSI